MILNVECFFHVLFCCSYSFSSEGSVCSNLLPIFHESFMSCNIFYIFWIEVLYQDYVLQIFYKNPWLEFGFLNSIILREKILNLDKVQFKLFLFWFMLFVFYLKKNISLTEGDKDFFRSLILALTCRPRFV